MHRTAVALALAASLLTSTPGLLDSFWSLLSSLWSQSTTDAGCGADPWGRCTGGDEGCGADPWGCPQGS